MSIIDFVEKIQNKPRYVRVRILWASVFICSFFVVSFWVVSLKHSVSGPNLIGAKEEVERLKDKTPSLMEALKASVSSFFEEELEEQVEEIKNEPSVQEGGSPVIKPMKLPLSE